MTANTKVFFVFGTLTLLLVAFLYGTQSFFHNKEIQLASEGCYEIGGTPVVEKSFLAFSYSFSCSVDN